MMMVLNNKPIPMKTTEISQYKNRDYIGQYYRHTSQLRHK